MSGQGEGAPSTFTNLIMLLLMFVLFFGGGWLLLRRPVMWGSFIASFHMFGFYEHFPWLMTANEYRELTSARRVIPTMNPTKYGFSSLMTLFKIHGYIGRWIAIPLLIFMGWQTRKGVVRFKYRRQINNVYDLIKIQAEHFPASAIIKDKNLLAEHPYVGPWATYQLPLDFALDNKLLWISKKPVDAEAVVDPSTMLPIPPFKPAAKVQNFSAKRKMLPHFKYVVFDVEKADETFSTQLGKLWEGHDKLPPLEKALFAIFVTQGNGQQAEAWKMVEQIAFSWRQGTLDAAGNMLTPHYADTKGVDELIAKYGNHPKVKSIIGKHAHTICVMTELLAWARAKGRLMHANFLWLKPVNRTLWYALCGQGGQSAYWEAAGPWAHAQVESLMGKRIVTPMVLGAIEAMKDLMSKEHWIDPGEYSEAAQQRRVKEANEQIDAEREKQRQRGGRPGGPPPRQPVRPPAPPTTQPKKVGEEEP